MGIKVSFNFLRTLYVYRTCIYVVSYIDSEKIVTKIVMGFKILCPVGGGGDTIFEIILCTLGLKYLVPNLSFFFSRISCCLKIHLFFRKFQKPYLPFKIEKGLLHASARKRLIFDCAHTLSFRGPGLFFMVNTIRILFW